MSLTPFCSLINRLIGEVLGLPSTSVSVVFHFPSEHIHDYLRPFGNTALTIFASVLLSVQVHACGSWNPKCSSLLRITIATHD